MANTKSKLQDIIEASGGECRSYSGRGMYGKECLAVDVGNDLGEFFASLVDELRDRTEEPEAFEEVAEAMRRMSTDAMGRGTIVYFTGTQYVSDEDDEASEGPECCAPVG